MSYSKSDIDEHLTKFRVLKLVCDFYSHYIELCESSDIDSQKYLLASSDVSVQYKEKIKEIDFLDSDLIFCAQDFTTQLTFETLKSSEPYFKVFVNMDFGSSVHKIIVMVNKIGNQWLITDINQNNNDGLEFDFYEEL